MSNTTTPAPTESSSTSTSTSITSSETSTSSSSTETSTSTSTSGESSTSTCTSSTPPSCLPPLALYGMASSYLQNFCHDIGTLMQPLPTPEIRQQVSTLDATLNGTVTRLDEFATLLNATHTSTEYAHDTLLPVLQQRCQDTLVLFQRIDQLASFMVDLETSITRMEERVDQVDIAYGETNQLKKMFKTFMASVKEPRQKPDPNNPTASSSSEPRPLQPIDFVLRTSDYFE